MTIHNTNKINDILTRGVEEIIDKKRIEARLRSGEILRVKFGIDPTSPNIHIGRSVPLLKLGDFQKLGHKIILIIGDFTGVVGDTSDKDGERPMLTAEQVKRNMKDYKQQAGKIIDINKCEIYYNSEWLKKLDYNEIYEQANIFSLNDFISRENIKKRLDSGKRVSLRELFYPLMQGYDSVYVKADIEIGGIDQRFNLLAGREMQRYFKQKPQEIVMNPLIEGLDGRKMSSSWGNSINLLDSPNDMYGKLMSLDDKLIIKYFILATRVEIDKIDQYKTMLESRVNPRDIKMRLAYNIVEFYHSSHDAKMAEEYFINTFRKKEIPTELLEIKPTKYDIVSILIEAGFSFSKTEARRNIEQNGVRINGKPINDPKIIIERGSVVQKGKRFFVKII